MKRFAAFLVSSLAFVVLLHGQQPPRTDADFVRKAYDVYTSMAQSSPSRTVPWQYLGPTNISGRATDVAVADVGPVRRIYAAFATSGVWQSDDRGATWRAIFEQQPSTSIGDIAVSKSNPSILYVGTGESNLFRASMPGVGVFKSSDGGRTFSPRRPRRHAHDRPHPDPPDQPGHRLRRRVRTCLDRERDARRLQDDRRRADVDEGALQEPGHRRHRSGDGLHRIRIRCTRQRGSARGASGATRASSRAPARAASGNRPTAGSTWTDANRGLPPASVRGRIGLDAAASNPKVLYAFVDNYEAGRPATRRRARRVRPPDHGSADQGERKSIAATTAATTWRKVSASNEYMSEHSATYGWVFGQIRVDPTDENTIYTLGLGLNVSRDAGKTFTRAARHARRPPRPLDRSHEAGDALQRERRRLLSFGRCGQVLELRARGGRRAVLQRDARLEHACVGLRIDPGRWQPARPDRSERGPRQDPRGRIRQRSRRRGLASRHRPRRSQHRLFARVLRELHALERRAAASRRRPGATRDAATGPRRTRTRRRHATSGRKSADVELRAQWMAPIITSVHEPGVIYADTSSSIVRPIAASRGNGSART